MKKEIKEIIKKNRDEWIEKAIKFRKNNDKEKERLCMDIAVQLNNKINL